MNGNYFGLVEMGFTLFAVLGFGFWELYKLKKER
jgi:hypothetical protein